MRECTLPESERRLREFGVAVFDLKGLRERLEWIPDLRGERGRRYELAPLLLLTILAKLSGHDTPAAIVDWIRLRSTWLLGALHLSWSRVPHQNTFRRVFSFAIEVSEVDLLVAEHLIGISNTDGDRLVSFDGKTVGGTICADDPHGEHLLAAYFVESGIVVGQVSVGRKENEIVAAPKLLEGIDLHNKIVIGDAMHTQRGLSEQIVRAGGDFVWVVKENQPTLNEEIATLFAPSTPTVLGNYIPNDFVGYQTVDKGHGRLEKRTITVSGELNEYSHWPSLKQVFRIERERTELSNGKTSREVIYGVTSLDRKRASPKAIASFIRAYWGIENGLHYRRDVTFKEDSIRQTVGNAGHVTAILNNLAIGLLRSLGFTNIAQARRSFDGHLNQPDHLGLEMSLT
jgi:predicted transposase YbfD/YdcC